MNFSEALNVMNQGGIVRRAGWNGKGLSVRIIKPESADSGNMTLPFIALTYPVNNDVYPKGAKVPWLASQTDLLSEDWEQA